MGRSDSHTSYSVPDIVKNHPAWVRLEDQIAWYDGKSVGSQLLYKRLKFLQIALAVSIPLAALLADDYVRWITSIAGSLIALIEGIQHMNQYSTLWVTYRSTTEYLKHEKYLFLSNAGPYRAMAVPDMLVLLSERVEERVSTEHANWFNETRRAFDKFPATSKD